MMLCRSKWITLALLLVTVGVDAASYSARKREEPSLSSRARYYASNRGYSLFRQSRYYAGSRRSSASQDAVRSNHYPGGTLKRTAYTGRYCAYTKTKMVQHKVPNGTETYLKQVRTKCSWSAVYCTPRVSYVVSTRRTFKTVMRNVSKEVWACCPGFEGENCDNACYNCTTISDLNDRVAALEEQIIGRLPLHQKDESLTSSERGGSDSKGEPGPIGPRGPSGETGAIGPRGPTGLPGQKGAEGRSGARGEVGPHGPMGAHGQKGEPGLRGPQGPAGIDGVNGIDGLDGVPGRKGSAGLPGLPGLIGQKGEAGSNGRDGEAGIEGPPGPAGPRGMIGGQGPQGEPGRPGPPGQCGCQQAEAETTPRPPPTKTTSAAAPEVTTGGYRACFYAGAYHNEDEMWTNENCEQCFCLDGAVTCLEITCPELECKYKYRPEGYCCDMCCRYQGEPSTDDSGDLSGDGEYETMLPDGDYDDDYNETSIDYTNMFISKNDSYGCPLPFEDDNTDAHPIDRCELRKDPGPCNRRYQRYYFDKVQQDCRLFMYGGCEGNANQFLTRQECLSVCQNQPSNEPAPGSLRDSACDDIPAVEGACKMLDLYFTYDRSTGRCHRFQYHGCGSSRNLFQTPNQCRSACNAGDPVYPGFVTQGGFIKDEPSSPAEIVMDVDVCSLPVETTNCKGSFHRYYYDQETRSCVEFGWGGCPETGPVNRFMTEEECNRKCRDNAGSSPMMKRRSPRCYEPKSEGNCLMHLIRFYYDADEDRCKKFTFGGCHGNRNQFVTPWDCREECGGGDPIIYDDSDICSMPVQIGKCRGILRRYYYDQKTARCIVFGWGGCEVNGPENRFDTEEECNRRCASQTITSRTASIPSPKCTEPVHPGPCRAHVYRFYYDPDTEQCSTFIYGGCNANGNNFASPEECKQQCGALTVNYTVTEPVEMQQNPGPTEGGNQRGERGPPGPPGIGIKGDTGPPGPPGPKADSATLDRYAEEIQFLKDQLTEITKMVLSHVGDMEKHSPAPTDGTDSESEDGESEFTIPPVDYFTNLEGSK